MKKIAVLALIAAMAVSPATLTFAQGDASSLVSGIGSESFTQSLDTLDKATSVQVVKLSTLSGASDAAVTEGLAAKAQDISSLQTRVNNSTVAKQALEGAGVTASDIVAISATGDGTVTLYANDVGTGAAASGGAAASTGAAATSSQTTNTATPSGAQTPNNVLSTESNNTATTNDDNASTGSDIGRDQVDPSTSTDTSQSANDASDQTDNDNDTSSN